MSQTISQSNCDSNKDSSRSRQYFISEQNAPVDAPPVIPVRRISRRRISPIRTDRRADIVSSKSGLLPRNRTAASSNMVGCGRPDSFLSQSPQVSPVRSGKSGHGIRIKAIYTAEEFNQLSIDPFDDEED